MKMLLLCLLATTLLCAQNAPAQDGGTGSVSPDAAEDAATDTAATDDQPVEADPAIDGPVYPISRYDLEYVHENAQHIDLERVYALPVTLAASEQGYIAPRDNVATVTLTIAEMNDRPVENYFASAVQRILETIRDFYVDNDYVGVYVAPDPFQINETGQDLRPDGEHALKLLITTGIVTELRTVASGERIDPDNIAPEERINNPVHESIIGDSPIKPREPETEDAKRQDLLTKDALDRYLFHKSRHPGRRIDASVAPAEQPGTIALDYMITENRPLVLYAQVSNTGTKQTEYWRYRFGFFHNQLTNNDDILNIDFTTSFSGTNSVSGSYERPFENDRIRWRVYGGWNEFTADQVGFFGSDFTGESWQAGAEIIANIYQDREFFLDLFGGMRYFDVEVNNPLVGTGQENFLLPYLGLRADKTTEWYSAVAETRLEYGSLNDVDEDELPLLGRTAPDDEWFVLRWDASYSVYLEPLINYEKWADPSTPESSTLAHELLFRTSGQHAFGDRLIPQFESVAGGVYTVRGYPESVVAGDSAVLGSVEYRYHIPKDFDVETEPRELFGEPFRTAPQYVYGRPDWDLVLKAFLDAGRVWQSDRFSFENDETLIGAGVGLDLLYRRNVNIRLDWGFALEDTDNGVVNSGSNRLHLVATFLF